MPSERVPQAPVALTVRLPAELHERLTQVAERELRSVNGEVIVAVTNHVRKHESEGSR